MELNKWQCKTVSVFELAAVFCQFGCVAFLMCRNIDMKVTFHNSSMNHLKSFLHVCNAFVCDGEGRLAFRHIGRIVNAGYPSFPTTLSQLWITHEFWSQYWHVRRGHEGDGYVRKYVPLPLLAVVSHTVWNKIVCYCFSHNMSLCVTFFKPIDIQLASKIKLMAGADKLNICLWEC